MSEPFVDLDIIIAERQAKDADKKRPTFRLGGHDFQCKRRLGGKAAIALGKVAREGLTDDMIEFISVSLKADEVARFVAVIDDDPEGDYDTEILSTLVSSIVEQYSGRPTQES